MERRTIYCSACDREVQVVLAGEGGGGEVELEGAVCMEVGERCTGAMCPVCAVPPERVRERLAGIETD